MNEINLNNTQNETIKKPSKAKKVLTFISIIISAFVFIIVLTTTILAIFEPIYCSSYDAIGDNETYTIRFKASHFYIAYVDNKIIDVGVYNIKKNPKTNDYNFYIFFDNKWENRGIVKDKEIFVPLEYGNDIKETVTLTPTAFAKFSIVFRIIFSIFSCALIFVFILHYKNLKSYD